MTDLMEGHASVVSRPLPVAGLDRIARRCMRRAPADRYQSAEALLDELRMLSSASGAGAAFEPAGDPLWWWKVHQVVIAGVHGAMPIAAWFERGAIGGPFGRVVFFAILILATISVTLRLNLWVSSRMDPDGLRGHRQRVFRYVLAADALLMAVLLAGAGLMAAGSDGPSHEGLTTLVVIVAVASLASLLVIEPATTRAAGLLPRETQN
jgi:hypothetical protein